MINLETIEQNVYLLLLKNPKLRNIHQRKRAIFKYWQEYEGIKETISEEQFTKLTNPETISRAIRKVLKDYPDFNSSQSEEIQRYEEAEKYRKYYEPFDFKTYLQEKLINVSRRDLHIIGLYWSFKNFRYNTLKAVETALKRDLRASQKLVEYTDDKINDTIDYLENYEDFKWTLETIFKYIDEDLDELIAKKKYNKNYGNY